jgi:hypothetical protein
MLLYQTPLTVILPEKSGLRASKYLMNKIVVTQFYATMVALSRHVYATPPPLLLAPVNLF